MDLLRSCYKRPVRYVAGDPSQKVLATWYFAAPTAKAFPTYHAFGSQNWDSVHPTATTLGDDANTKPIYYRGTRLNRSTGEDFAGPLEYFQEGAPAPAFLPRAFDGTPVVCLSPPFGKAGGGQCLSVVSALGGKTGGGLAVTTIAPGIPCANCSSITPATIKVTIVGCTGVYAAFNGTWTLAQTLACTWVYTIDATHSLTMNRGAGPDWFLQCFYLAAPVQDYTSASADCVTPMTLPFFFGPTPGFPPSVDLSV
jgi:hypothetical protein